MKETIEPKNLMSEEQKKLRKDLELVMATEGFFQLTEKQQRIIKDTLYIQARAERGTKERTYLKYKDSYAYATDRNCHSAMVCLEKESLQGLSEDAMADKSFFKAEYAHAGTISELTEQIENFGFPCVLHIGNSPSDDSVGKAHSSLVLGHGAKGEIILWEKKAYGVPNPYRIVTLNQIYHTYGGMVYYGLRRLRPEAKD